jgi:hypothetical protein
MSENESLLADIRAAHGPLAAMVVDKTACLALVSALVLAEQETFGPGLAAEVQLITQQASGMILDLARELSKDPWLTRQNVADAAAEIMMKTLFKMRAEHVRATHAAPETPQ